MRILFGRILVAVGFSGVFIGCAISLAVIFDLVGFCWWRGFEGAYAALAVVKGLAYGFWLEVAIVVFAPELTFPLVIAGWHILDRGPNWRGASDLDLLRQSREYDNTGAARDGDVVAEMERRGFAGDSR